MENSFENHPCFNASARKKYGRVHLPVAPRCNIQCRFCNRKFDCVNESRPGVASAVLNPYQALAYLDDILSEKKNIAVVGIAGPGDPFANAEDTMETMRLVNEKYPEMILCLATNGLNLAPYVPELAKLNVSHVTVTVNAVDPAVGEKVYAWFRHGKRVLSASEGITTFIEKQLEAIALLKKYGIKIKINTILLPGINTDHIRDIAEKVYSLGADIMNIIPHYPCDGAAFESIGEPDHEALKKARSEAGKFMSQMTHCARCRADAVGCLGESNSDEIMEKLQSYQKMDNLIPMKKAAPGSGKYVAVASREGLLINQHLGEARKLYIYKEESGIPVLFDVREAPPQGGGDTRWEKIASVISDCSALMVSGIGDTPKRVLTGHGIDVNVLEGMISDILPGFWTGKNLNHLRPFQAKGCGGGGMGCM